MGGLLQLHIPALRCQWCRKAEDDHVPCAGLGEFTGCGYPDQDVDDGRFVPAVFQGLGQFPDALRACGQPRLQAAASRLDELHPLAYVLQLESAELMWGHGTLVLIMLTPSSQSTRESIFLDGMGRLHPE